MAAPVNAAKVREGDKLLAEAEKWSVAALVAAPAVMNYQ